MTKSTKAKIDSFNFPEGKTLAKKYQVIAKLGSGWESEVYLVRETSTGIERAAKFFFPQRNVSNKSINFYAKKLHKLRDCPALIRYHNQETIRFHGTDISFLVSDFVEGEVLVDFLKTQPGKRLDPFQGLHLLHAIAVAVQDIHRLMDYHGDLHPGNVIVRRVGLGFNVKLLDFFHWGSPRPENLKDDIIDVVKIFYDAVGGRARYPKQPRVIKSICLGLKRTLLLRKFRTMTHLIDYLENMNWVTSEGH